MNTGEQIRRFLLESQADMLDFLGRLVLAESPSTSPESQAVPQTILWEAFSDLGFRVELIPGHKTGGQLLAQTTNGPPPQQLLIGHCDTVWPLGTLKEMPFVVEENQVRGPGVFDMKGGLTQIVFALKALNDLGLEPQVKPVILINSDEEIGSFESRPLINAWAQKVMRAFVLEPALGLAGKLKTARKGVGHFEFVVRGRAAHAGLDPEKGVSAILALSLLVQELFALNDLAQGISVNVGTIEGGLRSNVIAPEARASVDVRVPLMEDARRMEAALLSLQAPMPGIELSVQGSFGRPPLERTHENQALWRTAQALGRQVGLHLEEGLAGGGSDGNYTSLYTATLDGLGAVGDGAHARHEFLFVDKLIERTTLLALLLLSPLSDKLEP